MVVGSAVIDAFIGLSFVFFLMALFTSAVVEFLGNAFRKRAKYLLRGLRDILEPSDAAAAAPPLTGLRKAYYSTLRRVAPSVASAPDAENRLYQTALSADARDADPDAAVRVGVGALMGHPLVAAFKQTDSQGKVTRNPSYLPASTFAAALLDLLVHPTTGALTMTKIERAVKALDKNVAYRGALLSLVSSARGDLETFLTSLEHWYDAQMERVSGAYKRWAKRWVIVLALLAAIGLNVSSIDVARSLYNNPALRDATVAAAGQGDLCGAGDPVLTSATGPATDDDSADCVRSQLKELGADGLPLGWPLDHEPNDPVGWLALVLGWLLTAFAASFGAPFWFDALNRLGSLRNTGAKPSSAA